MDQSTSRRLPEKWIAKIFSELQGNYGTRFLNQWKLGQLLDDGNDAGVVNAMRVWAEKLVGFQDMPEVFCQVLRSLPPDPPTLPQFHELCRLAALTIKGNRPALDYKETPEQREANRRRLAEIMEKLKSKVVQDGRCLSAEQES